MNTPNPLTCTALVTTTDVCRAPATCLCEVLADRRGKGWKPPVLRCEEHKARFLRLTDRAMVHPLGINR